MKKSFTQMLVCLAIILLPFNTNILLANSSVIDGTRSQGIEIPAQDSTWAEQMSLKDCMHYALEHSAQIIEQTMASKDAKASYRYALLSLITPNLEGQTYAYTSFGRAIDPETNTYSNTTYFSNNYSISAAMPIFNGFQAVNNLKIARTSFLLGVDKERQIKDEICLTTMQAYFNAVYYRKMSEITSARVDEARKNLRLTQKQVEVGIKSDADLIQIQADLADREYQHILQVNSLEDALLTLKQTMMYPAENNILIDGSIECEINPQDTFDNAEDITENALYALPSAKITAANLRNAKLDLSTARWRLLPRLNLYGGWSTNYYTYPSNDAYTPNPFNEQFKNNGGEYLQLSLSIPIYNRLSQQFLIGQKRRAVNTAKALNDKQINDVKSEVRRALQDRNGSASAFMGAQKKVEAQEAAYAVGLKKFEQGLITALDLQTLSNQLLNAHAEQLNAMLTYAVKSHLVRFYKGESYIDQEMLY